jgi:5-oxoprolinase (ATP-hydrolysing) subunit A
MAASLDLNADVGEGFPHDRELLEVVTSANVACGFHAGDAATMRQLCGWCAAGGVAIGAQVSYRDRAGFGRRPVEVGYDELRADIEEQLGALTLAAREEGTRVAYLKPHGALYSRVVGDRDQARAVVDAAGTMRLPVLGLPGSALLAMAADAGLRVVREFFADRGYTAEGTLVPRSSPGALLTDADEVARRVARLVETGTVAAVDGTEVRVLAASICVHGDTPDAVGLARAVAAALTARSVQIRPFA